MEDVRAISVPPRFEWAYTFDWEFEYCGDTTSAYRAFHDAAGNFSCTAIWEAQEFAGLEADVSDYGDAVSFPWETWHSTSDGALPARFPFPRDFRRVKALYYDREPLPFLSKKQITSTDPNWKDRSGEPCAYFQEDDVSNEFIVWPRPSTATWVDTLDSGMVTSVDADTASAETGAILFSEDYETLQESGATIDVVDIDDSLLLVMDVDPVEPGSLGAKLPFPDFLNRYVRFGVLARMYSANTDGRIESLGRLWRERYEVGIQDVERFLAKRHQDRDYRFITHEAPYSRGRRRHPRLPDAYPAI